MQKQQVLKISWFVIRWGIAVFGIWYVISRMTWHDRVLAILPGQTMPQSLPTAQDNASDADGQFQVRLPSGEVVTLPRDATVNEPDKKNMTVMFNGRKQYVVGVDLSPSYVPLRLLLADKPDGPTAYFVPADQVPGYQQTVPHPRVEIGIIRMIRNARVWYLVAALAIFPITILITSFRWHELLKALDIELPVTRTFVLNMVGLFYNTFLPGSTMGDVIKAFYVARQTHHRTRAVMSVVVDRAVGLLALVILGGAMATMQWHIAKCRQVAVASAAIVAAIGAGGLVLYLPTLRKISGVEFIISKLPMQGWLRNVIETMHIYARRPVLAVGALLVSFPVHMVVIIAAMLCGVAFGLPIKPFYYWMAVPVIVLAGSIPISPQGAGVMEYFAINLLEPQHVTVSQAFALTMSIRLTQIFWNLAGGLVVLRGGFHAPTKAEQKESEQEDEDQH